MVAMYLPGKGFAVTLTKTGSYFQSTDSYFRDQRSRPISVPRFWNWILCEMIPYDETSITTI